MEIESINRSSHKEWFDFNKLISNIAFTERERERERERGENDREKETLHTSVEKFNK